MKKNINTLLAAAFVSTALVSCSKSDDLQVRVKSVNSFPQKEVSFDADCPEPESLVTKIVGTETSAGVHHIAWAPGDQFSMFGKIIAAPNDADLVGTFINFSSNLFTLTPGTEKSFSGFVPDLATMYGKDSGVKMNEYCIHPAVTVADYYKSGTNEYVNIQSGMNIPEIQDGTGWRYCYFFSRTAQLSAQWMSPIGGGVGMKFSLGNLLVRMKLNSTKNVTKIVLSTSDAPVMVGTVDRLQINNNSFWIIQGCGKKTLTIENGGTLPEDVYFALRDLRKDKTYTMTFTAEDGTTIVKSFKPGAAQEKKVINFGTVTLDAWT